MRSLRGRSFQPLRFLSRSETMANRNARTSFTRMAGNKGSGRTSDDPNVRMNKSSWTDSKVIGVKKCAAFKCYTVFMRIMTCDISKTSMRDCMILHNE